MCDFPANLICVRMCTVSLCICRECVSMCVLCVCVSEWVSEGDEEARFFRNRHSCVSLSVLLSEVCCDCSELETAYSSFLSASSSVPPLARAPWTPFLSSFFSCRLSRTKPGMQIMKEIVRRPRVRPRYAILRGKDVKNMIRKVLCNGNLWIKAECFNLDPVAPPVIEVWDCNSCVQGVWEL